MTEQIYDGGGQIVIPDIYFLIGMGMIPSMGSFFADGYNPNIRTDWETVWPTGGLYPWPQVATIIEISSSSGSDTIAGTGAQRVRINGLDSNWNLIEEIVDMNGTTPVQTTNQYLRVNGIRVVQVGSSGANVGTISADHGVEGILQTIEPNYNSSRAAVITIPAGYNIGLLSYFISLWGPSQIDIAEGAVVAHFEDEPRQILVENLLTNPSNIRENLRVPLYLPEKTDLEIVTVSDTGNRDATIAAGFSGIYVDVNYSDPLFPGPL